MAQANYYAADLIERIDVSANLAVFRFRPAEQISFAAGQYATIGVAIDGGVIERPYSIVSSPYESFLEFFVELVPGGVLTAKLWELKLGSFILVRRRIVGHFKLDSDFNHHLMLATVTGIAPFVSILRTQQIERARGAPADEILAYAKEEEIDIVCMGASGTGFRLDALLGSTVDRVLRRAPCPVFVARPMATAASTDVRHSLHQTA